MIYPNTYYVYIIKMKINFFMMHSLKYSPPKENIGDTYFSSEFVFKTKYMKCYMDQSNMILLRTVKFIKSPFTFHKYVSYFLTFIRLMKSKANIIDI